MTLDPMGLSGFLQHLIFRPQYLDPNDPRNLGGPTGLPGDYKVVFVLSRPGFSLRPEKEHAFEKSLQGDSHLAIAKPAHGEPNNPTANRIRMYAKTPDGSFVFTGYPNDKGFLGKIVLDSLSANDSAHAGLIAYRAIASSISNISVYLDIPMHIYQMDVTELRTNTVLTSLMAPFIETPLFAIPTEEMTEAFRIYASIYREALICNSANYQFLCYFKIIEGIRKRQERLIGEARAKGEQPVARPKLVIPQTREEQVSWLDSVFPVRRRWDVMALDFTFPQRSLGRKVNQVVDKELEPIRNSIAHSVLRCGEPTLSMDERLDTDTVQQWLELTKCIARLLMKSEFSEAFSN